MEEQDDGTLEFHEEAPMETLTRQAFRIPVRDKQDFTLEQDSNTLELVDVSISGNSVSVVTAEECPIDSPISQCTLKLGQLIVPNLDGRVIRCTPGHTNQWITGIQWSNIPADSKRDIENLLYTLRQELFETEE